MVGRVTILVFRSSLAIIGISLAIKDTMDVILELFSFRGRANRSWYFWHTLLDGIVVMGDLRPDTGVRWRLW